MPAPKQGDVAVVSPQRSIRPAPSNVVSQFPQVQATQALQRAIAGPIAALKRADILALQRTIGNRAVHQLLAAGSARQAAPLQRQSPEEEDDEVQRKSLPVGTAPRGNSAAPQESTTGLPDQLKAGVEALSGFAMDDVRVHYNSAKPATVQALAYAQGTDIHLGPGQEKHLPHEAWHVAQQKQGRVKPTLQLKGVAINDDAGLELEADIMGTKAWRVPSQSAAFSAVSIWQNNSAAAVQKISNPAGTEITNVRMDDKFAPKHVAEDDITRKAIHAARRGAAKGGAAVAIRYNTTATEADWVAAVNSSAEKLDVGSHDIKANVNCYDTEYKLGGSYVVTGPESRAKVLALKVQNHQQQGWRVFVRHVHE
jgi:hypothetical protein